MSSLKDDNIKLEVYRLYVHEKMSVADIARVSGIASSTLSDFLHPDPSRRSHKVWWDSIEQKPFAAGIIEAPESRRKRLFGKCFVFTSAQNNSFVHREFLHSLEAYCSSRDATLIVGTFSYNKTGFQNLEKEGGDWYDPLIEPYIYDYSTLINDCFVWCGELNILPTAVNPLSGLLTYTKQLSAIVPHAKLRLESCPRPKHEDPKFMYTTGCVTKANYIQKKEGQKAEFHHCFSAQVLEFDEDGRWFVRQLIADDAGGFYDLDRYYTPTTITEGIRAEAINWGDLHSEKADDEVYYGSFGSPDSLLDLLKPKYQLAHDTLDWSTRNHHNIKDMHWRFKNQVKTSDKVSDDVQKAADVLGLLERDYCQTIVVNSNHDQALTKWLNTADVRFDSIDNALFYYKCQVKILGAIKENNGEFSIFESCVKECYPDLKAKFLREDEPFILCENYGGISCENHGHLGINGSRGSIRGFTNLGSRVNLGHSHSAFIIDGAYSAGYSAKSDMGYNKGPTTWSHSHIITYTNGKRSIITCRGRKYKA